MIYLDLETWNEHPISNGTYRYAETAEIMLLAYAIDDEPAKVWDLTAGEVAPDELLRRLASDELVTAHNSMFDRTVLRLQRPDLCPPIERWRDSLVRAMAHSLPGSLDKLCEILKIPVDQAKSKEGRALVGLFCKPLPKNSKLRRATRETHPEEWERFKDYARLDVEAMRAVDKKLPNWNYTGAELALWHLDQAINDLGVAVDTILAEQAIRAVDAAQAKLAQQTVDITAGEVEKATQRDKLLAYILKEHGVSLPDMQADTLERRLNDPDLPAAVRELIAVRLQAGVSSVSKYKTLVRGVSKDGRLRGTLQFDGAQRTGRWAGRLIQPQNLPRSTLPQGEIDAGIEAIKGGVEDIIVENVMELCSNAIRGAIVAPSERKLVISDLSNIEGRVTAWMAGEQWKLQAFRDFDTIIGYTEKGKAIRKGPDLYEVAYAKAFDIPVDEVAKDQRQIGKVMELMLGYEGGVGAFVTGAATYGIDLEVMADKALPTIPASVLDEAGGFYEWRIEQGLGDFGLGRRVFVCCDALKRLWRQAHPAIAQFWKDLQEAAILAVQNPGKEYAAGEHLMLRRDAAWLKLRLPSGRFLCYPSPLVDGEAKLSYKGINQYTRKWQRLGTYGGKLTENGAQAISRDVMAAAMPEVEERGYKIVLTVHDEIVTETPDTEDFDEGVLSAILATNPPWAPDLPLAAGGFETYRYRKA